MNFIYWTMNTFTFLIIMIHIIDSSFLFEGIMSARRGGANNRNNRNNSMSGGNNNNNNNNKGGNMLN